ncbi:ATP-binding cassette domain-containing protein [Anaerolineae bacterium AMX1]|nr:ATP-binding cassette domain-containing protein [Anaerolineae bacterium AMX1]
MSLLTATSLSKSFGAEDIFRGVTFSVPKGARLAIVGPNGCGKTTLLRILVGEEEASSGTVTRARSARIGYLTQEADFQMEGTLWEACLSPFARLIQQQDELHRLESQLTHADAETMSRYGKLQHDFERRGGYTYVTRIKQTLTGLGFDASDYDMRLDHLSGGQRTRAFLARLLLSDPDVLLLDEPTNHLDIRAVEWLESYLAQWDGAAVLVSHDRYFLDRAANVILEMRPDGAEVYRGNYTHYLQQREERWNRREEVFNSEKEKLLKDVEYIKKKQAKGKLKRLTRVVQAIEQVGMDAAVNSNWSQLDIETTTSPFSVEEAERRVRALRLPDNRPPKFHLRLKTASRSGELVLRTKDLRVGYPPDEARGDAGKLLFVAEDITLRRRDCAALIGPNGSGKTTFLKTILGAENFGASRKSSIDLTDGLRINPRSRKSLRSAARSSWARRCTSATSPRRTRDSIRARRSCRRSSPCVPSSCCTKSAICWASSCSQATTPLNSWTCSLAASADVSPSPNSRCNRPTSSCSTSRPTISTSPRRRCCSPCWITTRGRSCSSAMTAI